MTTVQRWEKREGMPVHRHVHDKRGSVYALTSELDTWKQTRRVQLEAEEKEQTRENLVAADSQSAQEAKSRPLEWYALLALVVIAASATAYFVARSRGPTEARTKISSLAVLPLKNLSGDPSQDYLADGMTDALIGRLAGIRDLRVISHTSVMRFKNPQTSVPEIAKELNVDAIVEGSVIRDGDRVRVTAQLIRGVTDEHFWSETYDRQLQDVLTLQSELTEAIADKVQATVTGEEHQRLVATRTVAPEVYEGYLKGQFALSKGNSKIGIEESIADFNDAIHKDPTFAPAYVGLGQAYTALGTIFVGGAPTETRPKVMEALEQALKLDPDIVEAHVLLANTFQEQWEWANAESEYRKALQLNPNDADAHAGLALWLLCEGRVGEALASAQRGRELDPVVVSGAEVGWILFQSHRYQDALREYQSVVSVKTDDAGVLWGLGFVLIANNQPRDAIPVLEKADLLTNRSAGVIALLIRAYADAGQRAEAVRLLEELKARKKAGYVPAGAFVNAYLGLGETEQAFSWLEQAYSEHSNILQFLKTHPFFDPIRGDPRFSDLVRRVGLN